MSRLAGLVVGLLAVGCADEPAAFVPPPAFVAIRPFEGSWEVTQLIAGTKVAVPIGVPYEAVAWSDTAGSDVEIFQVGPNDDFVLPYNRDRSEVGACQGRETTYENISIRSAPDERWLDFAAPCDGTIGDLMFASEGPPFPRYILRRDVDASTSVVVDFTIDSKPLEERVVTVPSGNTGYAITVFWPRTTTSIATFKPSDFRRLRGSATSAHVVPAGDMLDGDVQLVGYMFDDPTSQATPVILSRVLFDVTGATAVPPVPYPVPVTELQQIREGMTFTTASTYNEWEVVEYLQDDNCISPSPRCEHSWTWKKTRGWPGSVSGTAELRYPDVSAIPGYSGGERPIPTSYSASVVIQLDLCDREDSMIACAPRAFARVKP